MSAKNNTTFLTKKYFTGRNLAKSKCSNVTTIFTLVRLPHATSDLTTGLEARHGLAHQAGGVWEQGDLFVPVTICGSSNNQRGNGERRMNMPLNNEQISNGAKMCC